MDGWADYASRDLHVKPLEPGLNRCDNLNARFIEMGRLIPQLAPLKVVSSV
jgi:hypothetical protein